MNITFQHWNSDQCSLSCVTANRVSGDYINIDKEAEAAHSNNGRIVKEVPCDRLLLLDQCLGHDSLKAVSQNCSFIVPADHPNLDIPQPFIEKLLDRKIYVLTEVQRPDIKAIEKECLKSFYTPSGELINKKFEGDLTPLKMAQAGLKFDGSESEDLTACYFNKEHKLFDWEKDDNPKDEHIKFYESLCIDDKKNEIPVLSSKTGQEITGKTYKLIMPDKCQAKLGQYCQEAIILSHSDVPIKQMALKDIQELMNINNINNINTIKASLVRIQGAGNIDEKYFDLLKKLVHCENFFELLETFKEEKLKFIHQLNSYISELHDDQDLKLADSVLSILNKGSVEKEVDDTAVKLANLEHIKVISDSVFNQAHESIRDKVVQASNEIPKNDLSKLATDYKNIHYSNFDLNQLINNGTLSGLFSTDYSKQSKRSESLDLLHEQGCQLTACLVKISEKIKELLQPFLPQAPEQEDSCHSGVTDLINKFEFLGKR